MNSFILIISYCSNCREQVGSPSPIQCLRQNGTLLLRSEAYFTKAGVRFLPLNDKWHHIYLHFLNFDMSLTEKGNFSRDYIHRNLLTTEYRAFGTTDFTSTCTPHAFGGSLVISGIDMELS